MSKHHWQSHKLIDYVRVDPLVFVEVVVFYNYKDSFILQNSYLEICQGQAEEKGE